MSVDPFIEAEKQGGHSVKRACELLGVSRAAFYARRSGVAGPRAMRDAELVERIAEVHARSRGSYGAPRVHAQLQRCGRRRVARLMGRLMGHQGRTPRPAVLAHQSCGPQRDLRVHRGLVQPAPLAQQSGLP